MDSLEIMSNKWASCSDDSNSNSNNSDPEDAQSLHYSAPNAHAGTTLRNFDDASAEDDDDDGGGGEFLPRHQHQQGNAWAQPGRHDAAEESGSPGNSQSPWASVSAGNAEALTSFDFATHRMPYIASVTLPQKHGEGLKDCYVSYQIDTRDVLAGTAHCVRRRFSDFAWLHARLSIGFPAAIVCPLPDKHRMEYITGDRFSADFIEKRRLALRRFLHRVIRHPTLQKSPDIESFLKSLAWRTEHQPHVRRENVLVDIPGRLAGVFARLKNPDARFVTIRGDIKQLENNLSQLEALYVRASRKSAALEQDLAQFGAGLVSLAVLEQTLTVPLTRVGAHMYEYTQALAARNRHEDVELVSNLRDYLAYCNVVRAGLRQRDEKQLECEVLADVLNSARAELDRMHSPSLAGPSKSQAIGSYIRGMYDDLTGVDQERARAERLARLETRISETESELSTCQADATEFSAEIAHEVAYFHAARSADLKDIFSEYTEYQINYFAIALEKWNAIVRDLAEIDTTEE